MNKLKLLIVDDEPQIRRLIAHGLNGYGYNVLSADNGDEGIALAAQSQPAAIILDIQLGSDPGGLEVCKALREWTGIPILVLSVVDNKATKLAAFDAGADDYITKPFDMAELEARIRAVLRRVASSEAATPNGMIQVRDLTIDLVKRRVSLKGQEIHLTPTEYDLLRTLAAHPGRVITNQMLLDSVWHEQEAPQPHYVRVFINTLRKKLGESANSAFHYITTEAGIGYRFADLTD